MDVIPGDPSGSTGTLGASVRGRLPAGVYGVAQLRHRRV